MTYFNILILLVTITQVLSSQITPVLKNVHLKNTVDQELLIVPFLPLIEKRTKAKFQSILESKVVVVGSDTFSIEFKIALSDYTTCDLDGYIDLNNLQVYETNIICPEYKDNNIYHENTQTNIFANNKIHLYVKGALQQYLTFLKTHGNSDLATNLDGKYNFVKRFPIFSKNLVKISWLNLLERGTAEYKINAFSDLTIDEFDKVYKMPKNLISRHLMSKPLNVKYPNYDVFMKNGQIDPPEAFDWRDKNAVTEVKNQGMCGSCWSFSTTGNVEGVHAAATGELLSLSEQELVDCDVKDNACGGGLMDNAFEEIERLGGLELESDYKYTASLGACKFDSAKIAVNITGFHDVPKGDEVAMQAQLLETGPLAIALNAAWMQFYHKGVSHPWKRLCNPKGLDHGVLIVGYGVEPAHPDHLPFPQKESPFWIIKNSWSSSWGEDGYYRIFRGDGTCGVDQYVTTAEV